MMSEREAVVAWLRELMISRAGYAASAPDQHKQDWYDSQERILRYASTAISRGDHLEKTDV